MTAQEEIDVLQSLKADTYFAQVFKPDTIDAMCDNIRKDFPIDCGVDLFINSQTAIAARKEAKILKRQLDERTNEIEDLHLQKDEMVNFLLSQANQSNDSETRNAMTEKAAELIGYREVIRRKINADMPLSKHDLEWLSQNL